MTVVDPYNRANFCGCRSPSNGVSSPISHAAW